MQKINIAAKPKELSGPVRQKFSGYPKLQVQITPKYSQAKLQPSVGQSAKLNTDSSQQRIMHVRTTQLKQAGRIQPSLYSQSALQSPLHPELSLGSILP